MKPVACLGLTNLFYGPDGKEPDRVAREARAKHICVNECCTRMRCLERAMVLNETDGVWGGMDESERKEFRQHLRDEGYERDEVPEGLEFWAALHSYYRKLEARIMARLR